MKTVTLEVTQRDIDLAVKRVKGIPAEHVSPGKYCCNCVVAIAGKRQFHNHVSTGVSTVSVYKKGKEKSFRMDSVGKTLVRDFDIGSLADVKPCKIVLTST